MSVQSGERPWWANRADHWKTVLLATSISFAVLATVVYALRLYATRIVSRSRVKWDESIMGLAVIFMWAETTSVLLKCFNGVGTPQEELPLGQFQRLNLGSWLVAKFCVLALLCSRVSIILFLKRIFDTDTLTSRLLSALIAYNVIWALVSLCMSIFSCKPVSYYWDKSREGGWCVNTDTYNNESLAMSVLGLASDLAILAITLPRVWRLQLKTKQKVAVTAVLGVGVVVCIFSLLRCVQFAYFDTAHLSTSGSLETLWTLIETDLIIVCGCLPQLRPLLIKVLGDSTNQPSADYQQSNPFHSGYGPHNPFSKDSGIQTTISSRTAKRTNADKSDGRDSDEIVLRGIEVHTEVNHGVTRHQTRDIRDDSSTNLSA